MSSSHRRRMALTTVLLAFMLTLGVPPARGQESAPGDASQTADSAAEQPADATSTTLTDAYARLLDQATSQPGAIAVHQVADRWYWEVSVDLLGRDLFWYAYVEAGPLAFAPAAARLVRLAPRGDSGIIDLYDLTLPGDSTTAPDEMAFLPDHVGTETSAPILTSLPVVAARADDSADDATAGALVLDVTQFFAVPPPGFDAHAQLAPAGLSISRPLPASSFVRSMTAYPDNVDVLSVLTYGQVDDASAAPAMPKVTLRVRHAITPLPTTPMLPRYADPRVGYFTAAAQGDRPYIARYYLQKQDPTASIANPVTPIVFYLDREIPEELKPYVNQAVLDWQAAFDQAGLSNAIIARDAPAPEEEPLWSPFDTRYSVIRWSSERLTHPFGPYTFDPRTGEILAAHVVLSDSLIDAAERDYFSQVAGHDETVRALPLAPALRGALVRYLTAGAIGHALGLRTNPRAGQVYSVEDLRDPAFTSENGVAPSILASAGFNYIVQPDDGVTDALPQIGPYDTFAIEWGYRAIPEALSPQGELGTLDGWAARQLADPRLAFAPLAVADGTDPTVVTGNLGDDRIEAARLGIENLARVMAFLVEATTETGGSFERTAAIYDTLLQQRLRWLLAATVLVGGVEETRALAGRNEDPYYRVSPERQRQAVAFLTQNLATPEAFVDAQVLNLLTATDTVGSVRRSQFQILDALLAPAKYRQLLDAEALDPPSAYTLAEFLDDLQAGLFNEYRADVVSVDPIRRAVQQRYLSTLVAQVDAAEHGRDPVLSALAGDLRGAVRVSLGQLRQTLQEAQPNAGHLNTQVHIADLLARIDAMVGDLDVDAISLSGDAKAVPARPTQETFRCAGDVIVEVVFDHENDRAAITLPSGVVDLPHVPSSSGAKYSDETTTFWIKGVDAFVEVDGEVTVADCRVQPTESGGDGGDGDAAQADADDGARVDAEAETEPAPPVIQATYLCDNDVVLAATFDNIADTVTLALPDGVLELPRAISGSGARYSDGVTMFWDRGGEAIVEVEGETLLGGCVAQ